MLPAVSNATGPCSLQFTVICYALSFSHALFSFSINAEVELFLIFLTQTEKSLE